MTDGIQPIQAVIELFDSFTAPMMSIINAANLGANAISAMQNVVGANIDTSAIQQMSASIESARAAAVHLGETMSRVSAQTPREPFEWQSYGGLEVFTNTGIERFAQETASVNDMLTRLRGTQSEISQMANECDIISPQAQYDIELLENRLAALSERIQQAEQYNIGTDAANAQMERLRYQLDSTLNIQENLNQAMESMEPRDVNDAYLRLSSSVSSLERQVRDSFSEPVQVPFEWQSANSIEVFNTSGAERWRQEIASAQEMMNRLSQLQQHIARNAVSGYVLPPNAANDMAALNDRLTAIQQRMTRISSRPLDTVSAQDIAQTEQLRMQLNRCLQLQEQMNGAANSLDLEAANRAYLELERTIGNTERFIRDNVSGQENFNNAVRRGQNEADKLTGFLKKAAGAFLSIKTVQKVVDISDQMTSINARLDMMNDGAQKTEELLNMTYAAAENARGSLTGMASLVTRIGNNARDAFSSNAEVIAFSELIQKQMSIAGASAAESSNAMLQLSQALGSGVLRGDELNSIFEQAPNIIQSIADYLDVPIGKIREMASEGEISAAVVKAAVFASADEVNEKFNKMPKTWGQVWQSMQNRAIMAMQPVLDKVSEMANSEDVQNGVTVIIDLLAGAAEIAVGLLGAVAEAAGFVVDNWSLIGPVLTGAAAAMLLFKVATTAATKGKEMFDLAMSHEGITAFTIVMGLAVGGIKKYTDSVNEAYGLSLSFAGMLGGAVMTVLAVLGNVFIAIGKVGLGLWESLNAIGENIWTFFYNLGVTVGGTVMNMLATVTSAVAKICELLNNLPFVEFDYSGIVDKADEFAKKAAAASDLKLDYSDVGEAWKKGWNSLEFIDLDDAFNTGYYLGDKMFGGENSFSALENNSFDYSGVYSAIDDIAANTGDISDSLEISEEELKYLRDIAEQEAVNRFTTAEITIEQTNNNTIAESWDIDGIVDSLTEAVGEAANIISEGVYD